MNNRRNFYRILHVDRDAPQEVITASYRSLLSKLRLHPDLGGDHETAVLVNQAYAVLRDPAKRAQYDLTLPQRRSERRAAPSAIPITEAPRCLFCRTPCSSAREPGARCTLCASPLTPVARKPPRKSAELFGRRALPRIPQAVNVTIYPIWPHPGANATLRDISPVGVSFVTALPLTLNQVLKLESPIVIGVARVVAVDPQRGGAAIRAQLLTAEFHLSAGSLVATRV